MIKTKTSGHNFTDKFKDKAINEIKYNRYVRLLMIAITILVLLYLLEKAFLGTAKLIRSFNDFKAACNAK